MAARILSICVPSSFITRGFKTTKFDLPSIHVYRRSRPGNHQHALHRVRCFRCRGVQRRPNIGKLESGWVEHDPAEIAARVNDVIVGALGPAGLTGRDLAAIGLTNQRETTVVWNPRTGRLWSNAIVWQDTRTDAAIRALEPHREMLVERTGLPPATYFSASKLLWILQHVDGVREAAAPRRGRLWHDRLVADLESDWRTRWRTSRDRHHERQPNPTLNPRTSTGTRAAAYSDRDAASADPLVIDAGLRHDSQEWTGDAEVRITGVLGDRDAATLGQACFAPGEAKNTYGTGNFMLLNTGSRIVRSSAGLLTTVGYALGEAAPVVRTRRVGRSHGSRRAVAPRSARDHSDGE